MPQILFGSLSAIAPMTPLTEHYSLDEMTHSDAAARQGIENELPMELLPNLKRTAAAMEQVRVLFGNQPVFVHSGYRNDAVNELVGGAKTSKHKRALCCDFTIPGWSNFSIAKKIVDSEIVYDQVILEYGWVHLGLAEDNETPRHQALTKRSAKAPYETGINV